jgi:kynurenine formamidase
MPEGAFIDLSRPLHPGMPVFPEDPEVAFAPAAALEPWRVTRLTLGTHSGTHIDAASHFIPGGPTIDAYPLERFVLPAHVVPVAAGEDQAVEWPDLAAALPDSLDGDAVLLHTGWDRWFGMPEYGRGAPFLTGEGAQWLIDAGAVLVGIDSVNIDDTDPSTGSGGGERPAHSLLLAAGVHVVEHLTHLGDLPARGARFTAAPPAVEGFGTFPVRAFAEIG